jgi:AraC-like DNA-binding protein
MSPKLFEPTSPTRPEKLENTHLRGPDTTPKIILHADVPQMRSEHRIRFAGHTVARRGNCFVLRKPDFLQILVTCSGRGWALVGSRWECCDPGTVYIQPPGRLHAYFAEPTQPWEFSWVIFDGPGPHWLAPLARMDRPFLRQTDPALLSHSLLGLYNETTNRADPLLIEMWLQLLDANLRPLVDNEAMHSGISRLWLKVHQDLAHPWTVSSMARIAGVSEEHLRRLCHRIHAQSPMERVAHLRVRLIEALLATSDCSLETIAAESGYSDANALSRAFLRLKGETPARYRRRIRVWHAA